MAESRFVAPAAPVVVVIPPPAAVVELRLTLDEAETLVDILYHIGGNPETTRRRYADSISDALNEVGFTAHWTGVGSDDRADRDGGIIFEEEA